LPDHPLQAILTEHLVFQVVHLGKPVFALDKGAKRPGTGYRLVALIGYGFDERRFIEPAV
jgi:hypothetical protein